MRVYGLKNCDKVRAAMRALTAAGHAPELVDIREAPLEQVDIERFFEAFGAALVNRRSTTWRQLSEQARQQAETDPLPLLLEHPTLIKRPVIDKDGQVRLGFAAKEAEEILAWLQE